MKTIYLSSKFTVVLIMSTFLVYCTPEPGSQTQENPSPEVSEKVALPSWNDSDSKRQIMDFVTEATNPDGTNFIPVEERIATFDNDGTLWSEQPMYFQLYFAIDRVKAMAADHPEWKEQQPFKAVLENDMAALAEQGEKGLLQIVGATHTGMTTDEFESLVTDWISSAQHPIKNKPFTELIYQPMLELLDYLRANDFKVFIVSGGGIEFMRPWTESVYGIPRDQVVGTSFVTEYDYNDGDPVIKRLAKIDLLDDKGGKPVGINRYIGRRPVFSAGNSDGDLEMLRWTDSNDLNTFKLYVHHTDSVREWAYDRDSHIGRFDKGLDEASEKGWSIVNMEKDWKVVYPYEIMAED